MQEPLDENLASYAFWAQRLLCAHRQWRVLATAFAKCQYGVLLLTAEAT